MIPKAKRFVNDLLEEHVVHRIPSRSIRDLHPHVLIPSTFLIITVMVAFFLGLFIQGYEQQLNQRYLSPSVSADAKLCEVVTIQNTGDYLLSSDGYWEGAPGFTYGRAKYVLRVVNTGFSESDYGGVIEYLSEATTAIGQEVALVSDLGTILLYWMSFTITQPGSSTNRFYLNGNPATIFNRRYTTGALTNQLYDCRTIASSHFDRANNVLEMTFNLQEYISSNCSGIADAVALGFAPSSSAKNSLSRWMSAHSSLQWPLTLASSHSTNCSTSRAQMPRITSRARRFRPRLMSTRDTQECSP